MTKAIIDIANPLGISVLDHIAVGKNGHARLEGLKLIPLASSNILPGTRQPRGFCCRRATILSDC